jgi:phage/plasmid-associated DNA primase
MAEFKDNSEYFVADVLTTNEFGINFNDLRDQSFAEIVVEKCFKTYSLISTDNGIYRFGGTIWKRINENNIITPTNFANVHDYYIQCLDFLRPNIDERKYLTICEKIGKLKNQNYQTTITKMVLRLESVYKPDLVWNDYPHLFAFPDCVLNLDTCRVETKNTKNYYLNISADYKALPYMNNDNKKIRQEVEEAKQYIKTLFNDIFDNDEEMVNYMFTVLSSYLHHSNKEELIYFWLGSGRNGKGVISSLMKKSFGQYFGELNVDYYTKNPIRDDAPNANLANLQYARVINTSEIGERERSNEPQIFLSHKVKSICGGDTITTRKQYQKNLIQFVPGKCIVQSNVLPKIHQQDGEVANVERIIVIPFDKNFVDDQDLIASNPSKYKQVNPDIKTKLQEAIYAYSFMELLVDYYRKVYKPHSDDNTFKSLSPEKVLRATKSFFEAINYEEDVNEWFYCNYDTLNLPSGMQHNPEKKLAISDLYETYGIYVGGSSPRKKISLIFFTQIITDIVGKRDTRNPSTSRGVYLNAGKSFLQGCNYYYYYYYYY